MNIVSRLVLLVFIAPFLGCAQNDNGTAFPQITSVTQTFDVSVAEVYVVRDPLKKGGVSSCEIRVVVNDKFQPNRTVVFKLFPGPFSYSEDLVSCSTLRKGDPIRIVTTQAVTGSGDALLLGGTIGWKKI